MLKYVINLLGVLKIRYKEYLLFCKRNMKIQPVWLRCNIVFCKENVKVGCNNASCIFCKLSLNVLKVNIVF